MFAVCCLFAFNLYGTNDFIMSDLSVLLFVALVVLYAVLKVLNLVEPAKAPKLFFQKRDRLVNQIVNLCPILQER